ncbi:Dyp-type peroxidase [Edwardsiella ictaluri]|uniref:Dyp-type peroxidase n=1 Tax=Edwardsiella ictaluri TaxID=67780 RepID=UPI0018DC27AD|nr:Dyp-type peroxidase [Edwardsiella ictaluri]QPW29597.1 Dyp-type peroxidase [Edwardsiella ictaluri]UYB62721.1 Dyp-type peroxidase [Edwardsiella ictaluri]UYB65947.1 Dyp-type peroxidase [Edwardsiella ictaluri]WJH20636.1 Dyp-type peroxidase [Edwardsiella ictaluri]BEH98384.1 Dyp-type peroxidase [Edwardsiella ictaluri]
MSQPQSGILPEHCRFGIFIEAMAQGDLDGLRQGCKRFITQLQALQQRYPDAHLGAVVAFGHSLWREMTADEEEGAALKPFEPLGRGLAPATQRDLLIHIQSLRHDVNFSLAQAALAAFGDAIEVVEEIHGFRWVDERDLSGFIDGTENPAGDARLAVGVIADGVDAGGSYVLVQRWEHNLCQWSHFSVDQQQQIIGRTKQDSEELDPSERPETSHVSRVDLKENGKGLKIIRQSLPYGTASGKHGLMFIAYCAQLHNIEKQLLSMFGELDGKHDQLLRFSKPVSGSYYFAPSAARLLTL